MNPSLYSSLPLIGFIDGVITNFFIHQGKVFIIGLKCQYIYKLLSLIIVSSKDIYSRLFINVNLYTVFYITTRMTIFRIILYIHND